MFLRCVLCGEELLSLAVEFFGSTEEEAGTFIDCT